MECWQRMSGQLMPALSLAPQMKAILYGVILYGILLFWNTGGTAFIYFQF